MGLGNGGLDDGQFLKMFLFERRVISMDKSDFSPLPQPFLSFFQSDLA